MFGSKVVVFGLGLATTLIVNRLLGPDGKGAFVGVTALPALVGTVGVFGLPNAINYYAAKGTSVRWLVQFSVAAVAVISVLVLALLWLTLPWTEKTIFSAPIEKLGQGTGEQMLKLILIAVPAGMLSTFVGTILYGRHEVRLYTAIMVGQAVVTLIVLVGAVGVFRLGVPGAVGGSIVLSLLGAVAVLLAVGSVAARNRGGTAISVRSVVSYGARAYPAGITGYFNYRADILLIQALLVSSSAPLGLYSMAVTMAELLFYVPDAVTTIFLPTIASSTPEVADAKLGRVSRLTMLMTVLLGLALIPVAFVGVHLILPKYDDSMPAFLVLLPGVVSLSLAKVMTSFIAGRGRPGPISIGGAATLILNLVANVILIPRWGIVGASFASLLSYTAMAILMVGVASHISRQSPATLIVPRKEEFRALWIAATQVIGRLTGGRTGA